MQYFGGKQRISKPLAAFLNSQLKPGQAFYDMFCGSCNVISKIDPNRDRIANDLHKGIEIGRVLHKDKWQWFGHKHIDIHEAVCQSMQRFSDTLNGAQT